MPDKAKFMTSGQKFSFRNRSLAMSAVTGSLIGFSLFLSACSYGPAPPVLIPDLMEPSLQKSEEAGSLATIHLLPTQLPENMTNVGILYKMNGEYSELVTEKPLGPTLDAILLSQMKASGLKAVPAKDGAHGITLQVFVSRFEDKVKEGVMSTEQSGVIEMKAVMILHSGSSTRTLTRTIERHRSPSSTFSFDRKDPSLLLGSMYSEALNKDLIPYVREKIGETP